MLARSVSRTCALRAESVRVACNRQPQSAIDAEANLAHAPVGARVLAAAGA
jgi:hypothetical protein